MVGFFSSKKVLVAGGSGLIGRPLVELLVEAGAQVSVASLDDRSRTQNDVEFVKVDLRHFSSCLDVCTGKEIVFNLAGVKGSPAMAMNRPASFFVPTMMFSINLMEAARRCGAEKYLYTSSIGVYAPAELFKEGDVWKTFPSANDKFAGWAKRMGELQAEAYRIEYGWDGISIVRPANVYGPFDNFDPENAMVIPSLIRRALGGENPLAVWGDGTAIRDFIHAHDVARGMMLIVENDIREPVNLGSGAGVSIKEIVDEIIVNLPDKRKVIWDETKLSGDRKRVMDVSRASGIGFAAEISLTSGIHQVMTWFNEEKGFARDGKRYNAFTDEAMARESKGRNR